MTDKLSIKGVVSCPCGGQILSNSGKGMHKIETNEMACWDCYKLYNANEVYEQRQENKRIIFQNGSK